MTVFSTTLLQAQNEPFRGGPGNGGIYLNTSLVNCNTGRFAGGFGHGDNNLNTDLLNANSFRFAGGGGRGDSSINTALVNNNLYRFAGGSGGGDSSLASNSTSCNTFRFAGGEGRGDSSLRTDLLDCNNFRFYGNSADGAALAAFIRLRNYLGPDTAVQVICSSESVTLLTLYDSTDLTFLWSTPSPDKAGPGVYQLIASTQNGCRDTAIATVFQEIAVWTGAVSNNWHTAANWKNNKVPGSKTHVIIPGGTANICQISEADAEAASVQGKLNGRLSVINKRHLNISANCSSLPSDQ